MSGLTMYRCHPTCDVPHNPLPQFKRIKTLPTLGAPHGHAMPITYSHVDLLTWACSSPFLQTDAPDFPPTTPPNAS